MARRWRLNPPPNWPTQPDGWEPDRDWSPDPAWGPTPVGWTLWHRERRATWLLRHRRSAGLGSAVTLTLLVALAGPPTSGTLTEAAPGAPDDVPPAASGALLVPRTPPDRPQAEPVIRLDRREPSASRSRRAEPLPAIVTSAEPTSSAGARLPSGRSPHGVGGPENGTESENGPGSGSNPSACRTPAPPPSTPQEPTPSAGSDRIITVGFTRGHCPSAVRQPGAFPRPTSTGSPEDPG